MFEKSGLQKDLLRNSSSLTRKVTAIFTAEINFYLAAIINVFLI